MHIGDLWNGQGLGARLARAGLLPLSGVYAAGWEAYLATYRLGFKRAKAPHHPVVCVGNLVTGGSGKSPLVIYLARLLRDLGHPVVISASGYGGPRSVAASVAPDGDLVAAEWGDEPAMFRWLLPDVPLIVGRRRVLAAELAHAYYPYHILLLDDGFQHLPLYKDVSLVLDDPKPVNSRCLPAGPYREGRWNRRRADLVLPGQFRVEESPVLLVNVRGQSVRFPSRFAALAGLGQPERFFAALEKSGGRPDPALALPDHAPLTEGTLMASLPSDRPIVVTAKDWVKLRERADVGDREFLVALHQVAVEPDIEFRAWWKHKLNE